MLLVLTVHSVKINLKNEVNINFKEKVVKLSPAELIYFISLCFFS